MSGPDGASPADVPAGAGTGDAPATARRPLYWRLLRLRHVQPSGWQRAVLAEGVFAVAVVLALADVASAWVLLVLPATVAAVVKGHDVLTGLLRRSPAVAEPGPRAPVAEPEPPATTPPAALTEPAPVAATQPAVVTGETSAPSPAGVPGPDTQRRRPAKRTGAGGRGRTARGPGPSS